MNAISTNSHTLEQHYQIIVFSLSYLPYGISAIVYTMYITLTVASTDPVHQHTHLLGLLGQEAYQKRQSLRNFIR